VLHLNRNELVMSLANIICNININPIPATHLRTYPRA
jgi:hypothetical protein